jgi:hypothetical protein
VRDLRSLIDDTEVTLAFYGSIVYLALVSALGAQANPPSPTAAISGVIATASVLYIAHVFAALVPKAARKGQLHRSDLAASLAHDVPLLLSVIVPVIPLLLASWEVIEVDTGYRLAVRLTIALLFGLAVTLSRRDGLTWRRALYAGLVIIAIAIAVIWLESHVH